MHSQNLLTFSLAWNLYPLEQKTDNKLRKFQNFINKEEFSNNHNFFKIYLAPIHSLFLNF